jgi:hypothetical protein
VRYLIAFVIVVLFNAGLRLATGQPIALAFDAVFALVIVAGQFLAGRWVIPRSAVPRRKGYAYPVFAIVFCAVLLAVSAYRLYAGVGSGRLLVSVVPGDAFVSWSDRPIGFVVMTMVYLLIIAIWAAMLWVMVLELKNRYQSRHAPVAPNSGTLY